MFLLLLLRQLLSLVVSRILNGMQGFEVFVAFNLFNYSLLILLQMVENVFYKRIYFDFSYVNESLTEQKTFVHFFSESVCTQTTNFPTYFTNELPIKVYTDLTSYLSWPLGPQSASFSVIKNCL
jgi:hypothetical protein